VSRRFLQGIDFLSSPALYRAALVKGNRNEEQTVEVDMKKFISIMVVLLIITGSIFAGGRRSSQTTDSGLRTLKVWGVNRQGVYRIGTDVSDTLLDFYEGRTPSRIWDAFLAEMTKRGIKLELDLVMEDQSATAFQTLIATGRFNDYDYVMNRGSAELLTSLISQGRVDRKSVV
jgi:hypothetical protein